MQEIVAQARLDRFLADATSSLPVTDVSDQSYEAVITATVCRIIGGGAEKPDRRSLPPPPYIASLAAVPKSVSQVVAPKISIGLVPCFAVTPNDRNDALRVPSSKPIADRLSLIALIENS